MESQNCSALSITGGKKAKIVLMNPCFTIFDTLRMFMFWPSSVLFLGLLIFHRHPQSHNYMLGSLKLTHGDFQVPLDCKKIKPVNPEANQPWIFIERTDAKAETPVLWPPDVKSHLIGKDLMLRKIAGRRRRGWQRMRWLDGITVSMDMNLSKHWDIVKSREDGRAAVHGITESDMT